MENCCNCTCVKKTTAKEYNDYRPIALTYVPFKCLERILLKHLLPEIEEHLDPYQFSYRKNKCTEDATLLYNNLVVEHLENKNAYVRSVFIDFCSINFWHATHFCVDKGS